MMKVVVVGLIVGMSLGAEAQAETFKDKSGLAAYVALPFEDTKMPDGSIVRRISHNGIATADLPPPWDHVRHQCTGTIQISADGKPGRGHGYCEIFSAKGDRAAFYWVGESGVGGRWTYFDGAGAFAGIKGEGTYKVKQGFPGGVFLNEWTGSWQTD